MTDLIPHRQSRAIQTRASLLDATLQTLMECGYSGTSTAAVCRRAGVARGTLLHHFPTRDDMLLAGLEHVLEARVATFVAAQQGRELPPVQVLLRELWEQWQGPPFIAWLELAVASRTNPSLGVAMKEMMKRFDALVLAAFEDLHPIHGLPAEIAQGVPFFIFAVFNGLAVGRCYGEAGQFEPVLSLLVMLSPILGAANV